MILADTLMTIARLTCSFRMELGHVREHVIKLAHV